MKATLLILVLAFLNNAYGQNKKDNTITVHGTIDYRKLVNVLFDEGFNTTSIDTNIIITTNKPFDGITGGFLTINKRDTVSIFKGLLSWTFQGTTVTSPIENSGMKNSASKQSFEIMDKIAKSFGLPVTYSRIRN